MKRRNFFASLADLLFPPRKINICPPTLLHRYPSGRIGIGNRGLTFTDDGKEVISLLDSGSWQSPGSICPSTMLEIRKD